ncbi:CRISPR-associated endonuclease Cas3'' [Streptomyces sp. RFCAC02]|uniref:CRISPR-associated endonuclease Cas3'' n=1 Tax=Streptomyces sp. RFCAC02 TaxID=2499143 RepID=UPI0010206B29|nr:CRISPR-associated endonuclease Cas3'' [Streptomyces sp. RFCAC02]
MLDARLCGKSSGLDEPYPVIGHLIDTAMVCGAVWDRMLAERQRRSIAQALGMQPDQARRTLMFWAGLHDLGKIMPQFQHMIARDRAEHCAFLREPTYAHSHSIDSPVSKIRHEIATHRALPQLMAQLGYPITGGRLSKLLLAQVAQLLGGHHGRYPTDNDPRDLRDPVQNMPELGSAAWAAQRSEHVTALHHVLGGPPASNCAAMPLTLAVVVAGMVIVSDWVASQEHVIKAQQRAMADVPDYGSAATLCAHACRVADAADELLSEAGLGRATFRAGSFRDLFPEISSPYPLQMSVEAGLTSARMSGPGILLVTAPTGEGKTETALYAASLLGAASGSSGLFFALPTQATANQMYGRLVQFARNNLRESAPLTLLHGAADLFEPYAAPRDPGRDAEAEPRVVSDCEPGSERHESVTVEAGKWLRRRGRGILAPLAVGTIDQALMGVLPLKRNALRHLGLSAKTVIIDEAHAFDAYTHALLLRLLEWLGALGTPVVLLSATLTGELAQGMIRSYLSGADPANSSRKLPAPAYPGWLYASARSDLVIEPAGRVMSDRKRDLAVEVRHVTHTYEPARQNGRLAALFHELDAVSDDGGCVAVICTTVAEAQQTYAALRDHLYARHGDGYLGWDDRSAEDCVREDAAAGPRLRLLHARFPARRRAALTDEAERWFGRTDKQGVRRPTGARGAILVATQVIEQSLDLDFDLVISDLAPMAMLLQRAGRVWRHRSPGPVRPAWSTEPRLVVLAPVGEDGRLSVPVSWGDVYSESLLQRTLELFEQRGSEPVAVPGDVQGLVDAVYAAEFVSVAPEVLMERDFKRLADDMAKNALATMVALPPPGRALSLHPLTASDADEDLIRTRLGADSVPVLPIFETGDGRWLDEQCTVPLPERGRGRDGRYTMAQVRDLLSYVAPLAHGKWRAACGPANEPPAGWSKEPRLARLVLLPQRVSGGEVTGDVVGEFRITSDYTLGLVTKRE